MLPIKESFRVESSPVPLCDGHGPILIGIDLRRKLEPQHLDDSETGQQAMRVAQRQSLWMHIDPGIPELIPTLPGDLKPLN
jgi:hypothetical protein